jgi:uroporphyrinogen decarboxylase
VNSRERVWTALSRQGLPDRVPLQFDLSRALLEQFGREYAIPVHYTQAYYEDVTYRISGNELRVAMGSDCVLVGAGLPRGYRHPVRADGQVINEFGMKMRQGPLYMELVEHPLAHVKSPRDIEAYPFPDPLADGRFDDAALAIAKYQGQYFVWGDAEVSVFALARNLVGMQKLLIDMALGEPYVESLFDKCQAFTLAVAKRLVSLGVDGILAGDDYGAQNGMLISPAMWRQYFKERHRAFYAELKSLNPDLIIAHHCDGAVAPILAEWVEVGLDVFNPVQPNVPGHAPEDLKNRFGDRLSFWGAIDQQQLLPFATPEEIDAKIERIIGILGQGGGYMASPAHIIQPDTPMENVEAFIRAVKMHGVYEA